MCVVVISCCFAVDPLSLLFLRSYQIISFIRSFYGKRNFPHLKISISFNYFLCISSSILIQKSMNAEVLTLIGHFKVGNFKYAVQFCAKWVCFCIIHGNLLNILFGFLYYLFSRGGCLIR